MKPALSAAAIKYRDDPDPGRGPSFDFAPFVRKPAEQTRQRLEAAEDGTRLTGPHASADWPLPERLILKARSLLLAVAAGWAATGRLKSTSAFSMQPYTCG